VARTRRGGAHGHGDRSRHHLAYEAGIGKKLRGVVSGDDGGGRNAGETGSGETGSW
jgi:hypothetical protein